MPQTITSAFADSYDVTPGLWSCAAFLSGCRVTEWLPIRPDYTATWRDTTLSADAIGCWDHGEHFVLHKLDKIHECKAGNFTAVLQNPVELRRVI